MNNKYYIYLSYALVTKGTLFLWLEIFVGLATQGQRLPEVSWFESWPSDP